MACSKQRDTLAEHESEKSPSGFATHRLEDQDGSHRILERDGSADYVFAYHDGEEIGPQMLARMGRRTGLIPDDL